MKSILVFRYLQTVFLFFVLLKNFQLMCKHKTNYMFVLTDQVVNNATNILTHAFNSIVMFIDIWIVAYPIRLLHFVQPISFGLVYLLFSGIYYLAGGTDG